MTPESYRRIREIFDAALAVDSSGRASFLRDACGGDRELEGEVGKLLAAHDGAGSFLLSGRLSGSLQNTTIRDTEFSASTVEFIGTERFRVIRKIGAGGFGVVYQVADCNFDSVVALKTLPRTSPEAIGRLKREFRALAEVTHPNLAALYELIQEPEHCFFTMEFVDGLDFLQHALSAGHGAELRDALAQLASGVHALHDAGKLHCDLKPHNVLVDRNGRVVILDFGLTTEIGAAMGAVAGTPEYMAPEQAQGLTLSQATDWYAVGAMLYHALAGRPPTNGSLPSILGRKRMGGEMPPSDLGHNVPEDLGRLCIDLLALEPSARPTGLDVLNRLGRSPSSISAVTPAAHRLIGRETELSVLSRGLERAAAGSVITVLVHGVSGSGKTALITQYSRTVRQQGRCLVLEGRCYERESVPFKALDGLIEALSRYLRTLPEPDLAHIFPEGLEHLIRVFPALRWAKRFARTEEAIPDLREVRLKAFQALLELLRTIASDTQVVLILDDLQWGDADSAPFIRDLQSATGSFPVLLVVSYRSDQETTPLLGAILPALKDSPRIIDLPVRELNGGAAIELASELLTGTGKAQKALAAQIASESGGNPFFLTELVKHSERHAFQPERMSLEDTLQLRIACLSRPACRLLRMIAVAGQPLDVRIAIGAAAISTGGQGELVSLSAARFIRRRDVHSLEAVEIWHDRIREITVESLDPADRTECHFRLATTWEASSRPDCGAVAVHYIAAGIADKGKRYALEAAGQASETLAFESAARFYRLALQAASGDGDTGCLQRKLGDALSNAGRGKDAGEAYIAAASHSEGTDKLDLLRRAATQYMITGHVDLSMPLVHEVARITGMRIASSPLLAVMQFLFWRGLTTIRGTHFRERGESEIERRELLRVDVCFSIVQGLGLVDLIRAHPFQARGIWLALGCGEPCRMSRALALWAAQLAIPGKRNRRRVDRMLAQAEALARRGNSHLEAGIVRMAGATAAFLYGNWRDAAERFAVAEAFFRQNCTAVYWDIALCHMMGCTSLLLMGRLRRLGETLPRVIRDAEIRGDLFEITDLRIRLSHAMLLAADDPGRASSELENSISQWRTGTFDLQHWWALIASTEIDLYAGQEKTAWERWRLEWPSLRRSMFLVAQYIRIESLHHRGRAALALAASGKADSADLPRLIRRARHDARRLQHEDAGWCHGLAALLNAGIAAHQGRTSEASILLSAGEAACRAADMELYAAAAQRMRGVLEGGRSGSELIASADEWMTGQGIRNPARMSAMLVPGIDRSA